MLNSIIDQLDICNKEKKPVCVLVRKGTFESYKKKSNESPHNNLKLEREEAVEIAAKECEKDAVIVCTTGMLSRELFEYRANNRLGHGKDFLCVGGMGHASQIATGISINQKERPVYCFDGISIINAYGLYGKGNKDLPNLIHIVFNNGCHESVGGQPTVAQEISLSKVALSLGYKFAVTVDNEKDFVEIITRQKNFIQLLS